MSIERSTVGWVAVLTINRPEVRNALDMASMRGLGEHVSRADSDPAVRVIVITGAGDKAFCAGGDLAEMCGLAGWKLDQAMGNWSGTLHEIEMSRKPVLAAVNGFAIGRRDRDCAGLSSPDLERDAREGLNNVRSGRD